MTLSDLVRAKRCAVGNRFFLEANFLQKVINQTASALQNAIDNARFRYIPSNQRKLDAAIKDQQESISLFEAHLSECDKCCLLNRELVNA